MRTLYKELFLAPSSHFVASASSDVVGFLSFFSRKEPKAVVRRILFFRGIVVESKAGSKGVERREESSSSEFPKLGSQIVIAQRGLGNTILDPPCEQFLFLEGGERKFRVREEV